MSQPEEINSCHGGSILAPQAHTQTGYMMPKYRPVYTKIWKDKDFLASPKDAKLLFLYLITNESFNNSGVYEIPVKTISHETGIPVPTVTQLLGKGSIRNVLYDAENEIVLVENARKYSPGGNPTQVEKGILSEYKLTSKTFLWKTFVLLNPQFKEKFSTVDQGLPNRSLPLPLPLPIDLDCTLINEQKEKEDEEAKRVLAYLNQTADKNFEPNEENLGFIKARLKQYGPAKLFHVVDVKTDEWKDDPKWDTFLRPSTLFNKTKCETYVNQKRGLVKKPETTGSKKLEQIKRLMKEGAEPIQLLEAK